MLTSTTQALLQLQPILYALDGLHATAWKMRAHPALAQMRVLQKGNRLSISEVTPAQWHYLNEHLLQPC